MKTIKIEKKILEKNEEQAAQLRKVLKENNILTINLLGSPGAGKTTILEKLLANLGQKKKIAVIEGDLYTNRDAERLEKHDVQIIQINTGGACHLEANMVRQAVAKLNLLDIDILVIENVGNLVCTASYDLGEDIKITVLSVPEGSDKLLKYPHIFQNSEVLIINKIDLIPHTDFSLEKIKDDLSKMNKNIKIFKLSCKTQEGIEGLCEFLEEKS